MNKEEIIRRLKKMSRHAVHFAGEQPLLLSLDDGIALNEVIRMLEEQEQESPFAHVKNGYWCYVCPTCGSHNEALFYDWNYCPYCGQAVEYDG